MREEVEKGLKCCAEVHLWHSGLVLAVYNKLYQLTYGQKGKGEYFAKLDWLADLFKVSYNSIWRAKEMLVKLGFLELITDPKISEHNERSFFFRNKRYRVVKHQEWAEKHPGQCYEPLTMPWDECGDALALKLFAVSAGTTWYRNMLASLRRTKNANGTPWTDDQIVMAWKEFIPTLEKMPQSTRQWESARGKFLRAVRLSREKNEQANDGSVAREPLPQTVH